MHYKRFCNENKIYEGIDLKLFKDSTYAYCIVVEDLWACYYSKWTKIRDTLYLYPIEDMEWQRDYIEKYLMLGDELIPIISEKQITLLKASAIPVPAPSKKKSVKLFRRFRKC
jgi:hypothetical protein